jgi:hypothetical protein
VWVQQAANVKVENISGRAATFVLVAESQDVTLRNLDADVTYPHTQGGRLLSLWQADRVQMFDSHVHTPVDQPVVFLESYNRDTLIDGLDIDWDVQAPGHSNVLHFGSGSVGIFVDNVTVHNTQTINFVGTGGTYADYRFGAVEVTGPVTTLPAYLTTKLTVGGHVFSEIANVHKDLTLEPNGGAKLSLVSQALVRRVVVTLSNKTGVQALILQSAKGAGSNLLGDVTAGQPFDALGAGGYGSLYQFNDLEGSEKYFYIVTGPDLAPGTTVSVDVEYYKF